MSAAEVMKWSAVHNKVLEALRLEEALEIDYLSRSVVQVALVALTSGLQESRTSCMCTGRQRTPGVIDDKLRPLPKRML